MNPHDDDIKRNAKKFRLMQLDPLVGSYILRKHGLEFYETNFLTMNPSNDLPYHNQYHTYCMVLNCYEGALFHDLDVSNRRALLVAALFHDFNHSGGTLPDELNIERALAGLAECHRYIVKRELTGVPLCGDHYARLSPDEYSTAVDLIKVTKYPYEQSPATLAQEIIRDADLMQVYEERHDRLLKQYLGLKVEVELTRGPFTTEEWADGCREFQLQATWHTAWAKAKASALNLEDRIDTLRSLLLGNT